MSIPSHKVSQFLQFMMTGMTIREVFDFAGIAVDTATSLKLGRPIADEMKARSKNRPTKVVRIVDGNECRVNLYHKDDVKILFEAVLRAFCNQSMNVVESSISLCQVPVVKSCECCHGYGMSTYNSLIDYNDKWPIKGKHDEEDDDLDDIDPSHKKEAMLKADDRGKCHRSNFVKEKLKRKRNLERSHSPDKKKTRATPKESRRQRRVIDLTIE